MKIEFAFSMFGVAEIDIDTVIVIGMWKNGIKIKYISLLSIGDVPWRNLRSDYHSRRDGGNYNYRLLKFNYILLVLAFALITRSAAVAMSCGSFRLCRANSLTA